MIDGDIMKKVYYYCLRRTGEIHHAEDLAGDIILEAYDNYCTIEELCIALGVSAPYLEEVVDELEQGLLLKKTAKVNT